MLVALIPPPIDHLGERRLVRRSLKLRETGRVPAGSCPAGVGSVCSWWDGGFGAVVEQTLVAGADRLVDDEEIEIVMLR